MDSKDSNNFKSGKIKQYLQTMVKFTKKIQINIFLNATVPEVKNQVFEYFLDNLENPAIYDFTPTNMETFFCMCVLFETIGHFS